MSQLIRAFIAVPIPLNVQQHLKQHIKLLKNSHANVKWVHVKNMHLTLKFLGDIEKSQINEILTALDNVLILSEPFQVNIKGTGAFPHMNRPRVFWAGLDEGGNRLKEIAKRLDSALFNLGFPIEKKEFCPHLTLGRVRSVKHIDKACNALSNLRLNESFDVEQVVLMKSDLQPTGAMYTPIHHFQLRG